MSTASSQDCAFGPSLFVNQPAASLCIPAHAVLAAGVLLAQVRKYASTQPAGRAALSTTAAATQHQHNTRVTDCSYQDPATPSSTCYPPAHYRRMATAVQCPAIIGHGAAFREPATGSSTLSDPPSFLGTSPQLTWGHIEPEQPPEDVMLADALDSMESDVLPMMPQQGITDFVDQINQQNAAFLGYDEPMAMCMDDGDAADERCSATTAGMEGLGSDRGVAALSSPVFDTLRLELLPCCSAAAGDSPADGRQEDMREGEPDVPCSYAMAPPAKQGLARRKSVQFTSSNIVRIIPAAPAVGAEEAEADEAADARVADTEVWMKTNDGPSSCSVQVDRLIRAMFEHRCSSCAALQRALGPQACAEVQADAPEIAGRLYSLGERLAELGGGGARPVRRLVPRARGDGGDVAAGGGSISGFFPRMRGSARGMGPECGSWRNGCGRASQGYFYNKKESAFRI
eukprot:COSAG01_NODE_708_length_14125_cov_3.872745_11_plen_458_part_00